MILPDVRFDLGKSDLEGGNARETTTTKTSKQKRNKQTRNKNIAMRTLPITDYRKLPLISPGLIQLRRGFGWVYNRRALYPGVFISGIIKTFLNEPQQC